MSKLNHQKQLAIIEEEMGEAIVKSHTFRDLLTVDVTAEKNVHIISFLRRDSRLDYAFFVDLSCTDYLTYDAEPVPGRYAIVYILYSLLHDTRIRVRAFVSEAESSIKSIYSEYKGALLTEREVYDMYGIHIEGHPDLRRLLMPEDYGSYPLKKDYPLQGLGERSEFPKYNIYEKLKQTNE